MAGDGRCLVVDGGVDPTRRNGRDVDTGDVANLKLQRPDETELTPLGGDVGAHGRRSDGGEERAHDDERSTTLTAKRWEHGACDVGSAVDGGVHDLLEDVRWELLDSPVGHHGRGVDDDVDSAPSGDRCVDDALQRNAVVDVTDHDLDISCPGCPTRGRCCFERHTTAAHQHDPSAARSEPQSGRASDAARSPDDNGHLWGRLGVGHGLRTIFTQPSCFFWNMS